MIWGVFPQNDDWTVHPTMEFATQEEAQKYAEQTGVECLIECTDGEVTPL